MVCKTPPLWFHLLFSSLLRLLRCFGLLGVLKRSRPTSGILYLLFIWPALLFQGYVHASLPHLLQVSFNVTLWLFKVAIPTPLPFSFSFISLFLYLSNIVIPFYILHSFEEQHSMNTNIFLLFEFLLYHKGLIRAIDIYISWMDLWSQK